MDFALSDEQEAFRDTLRRFLAEHSPTSAVRRHMATPDGIDRSLWKQMSVELGLPGIALPEAYGGQGFGAIETAIVMQELGRSLACVPYLSSVCLGAALVDRGARPEERESLLPALASGERRATVAWLEPRGGAPPSTPSARSGPSAGWDPAEVALEASGPGDEVHLSGTKRYVLDGRTADLVIVVAREPGSRGRQGLGLFAVDADAPGLETTSVDALDATRALAHLSFDGVAARRLDAPGTAAETLEQTLVGARVALAAESLGGAERSLEAAVSYARERVQFARPIGSFQAVKHRLADLLLELEGTRSLVLWASWAAAENDPELALAASLAKASADETFAACAAGNLHVHGGIGITWEADPHLFLKRSKANELLLGDPVDQRRRVADALGI